MREREVQGRDGVAWSCVQALSGLSGEAGAEAEERLAGDDGVVPVVCTPRGGERSVRLELPRDWAERMGDDELRSAIDGARETPG